MKKDDQEKEEKERIETRVVIEEEEDSLPEKGSEKGKKIEEENPERKEEPEEEEKGAEVDEEPKEKVKIKTDPVDEEVTVTSVIASDMPEEKKKLPLVLLVIMLVVLIVAGIFVWKKKRASQPSPETATEEVSPTAVPEPTVALERKDLKVEVLNGTGEPGIAGTAKDFLEGLGYQSVEVGNASSYDYEETEVAIKEEKKAYLEMVLEDLAEEYTVASETGVLDEASDFDLVITLGEE